jgi:hypothetical protein
MYVNLLGNIIVFKIVFKDLNFLNFKSDNLNSIETYFIHSISVLN